MRVWRITRKRHALTPADAFSGEGARRFGARWNPPGVPIVYTSSSLSLAVIEIFVHLEIAQQPDDLISIAADLPSAANKTERLDPQTLPRDWRRIDHPALPLVGAEWAKSARSLALLVPSAVVEGEWNVLVNPAHPEAAKIVLSPPVPFHFDARMFKR